jgi:thiamine transporter ThiT
MIDRNVLFVASSGGHLVQLLRLDKLYNCNKSTLLTTDINYTENSNFINIVHINDVNEKSNIIELFIVLFKTISIILKYKPEIIITTGALPGLITLIVGKVIFRKKTIWIDSIANATEISKSGKYAQKFSDLWLTQWEHLANDNNGLRYLGSVL